MCILGEPTESKLVLAHFGSLWLRISTRGEFIHTAFSEGKRDRNSILRMHELTGPILEWVDRWEADPANACDGVAAIVNIGAIEGGFPWRVSRTPHRTDLFLDVRVPPGKPMALARREALDLVRELAGRYPGYGVEGEVFVSAPGAEIEPSHPLISALEGAHSEVFGSAPARDVTRWYSDASALTRAGIATVNYGTSTGLLDTTDGENLDIEGLVKTAQVYALAAIELCGVAA
jgi:acetylornithine deacetylase/succinyl-diaminopimelate desuccinylase-like protein